MLHAPEVDGRIELAMVYNADLFSEHRIVSHARPIHLPPVAGRGASAEKARSIHSCDTIHAIYVLPDPTESLDEPGKERSMHFFAKQAEQEPDLLGGC